MIEKMIEKILDKYYAKKLLDKIEDCSLFYVLDRKKEIKNGYAYFYIKKKKYKDFTNIFTLPISYCFAFYLKRKDTIQEYIDREIKTYLENEK